MKMKWNTQGLSETINILAQTTKEGKSAQLNAELDTGKMVKKELQKARNSGEGLKPLGFISKLLGHKKPWGKKKFNAYVPKKANRGNPFCIVTTRGANKNMEEGGEVTISDKFRRFLHTKGVHLRKGKKRIPARPLFALVWGRMSSRIPAYYSERFHYRLGRALRRWRVKE